MIPCLLAVSPTIGSSRGMTGPKNSIADVAGVRIGHADDAALASGVTVALFDEPAVAAVTVPGGAPAGRDQEGLEPDRSLARIDAIVLSGGSGFGLDAATGVQAWCREQGRGFRVRDALVPIVPSAILFDLLNGGDKHWGRFPPYRDLAYRAAEAASGPAGLEVGLGTIGGGYGATTYDLKGGVGTASAITSYGHTVGALSLVNAIGSAVIGGGPHFWAAPFEEADEFGGLGLPPRITPAMRRLGWKGGPAPATTIALVATDATLTKADTKRLAIIAQGGLAKALRLSFAARDGDTVFAASTGRMPVTGSGDDLIELGGLAADCLARAVARGVYEASALPFSEALPAWRDLFGTPKP